MPQNDYLPFCPTDTGTNLLSEADYLAAADRVSGNKPGIASSQLNNRALRQSAAIASQLAQLVADTTGDDVLDDANEPKLLSLLKAALGQLPPRIVSVTSGTGTLNSSYYFYVASANATSGATYTNNSITFTVLTTIASGTLLHATGPGAPLLSGTLTKASGTGDATITFYAIRKPLYMDVELQGAGGGGAGGNSGGTGTNGADSTFGSAFLTASGGQANGGTPGAGTGGDVNLTGGIGNAGNASSSAIPAHSAGGGAGGASPLGGAGASAYAANGIAAAANTGAGGGGGGTGNSTALLGGSGGSAGGYLKKRIFTPSATSTWGYAVGAKGTGGANGAGAFSGADGAAGILNLAEYFQ